MLTTLYDLPFKARMLAEHCLEHFDLRQVIEMLYFEKKEHMRVQFDLSEEQWQDALYVVIKEMGRSLHRI